jgi:CHAD domain-containing protein
VLGDRIPVPPSPKLTPKSPAGTVVVRHLHEQIDELILRNRGARTDEPDAVHKMRVATRRLRSALATYRPLFASQRTEPTRQELAWLGTALGKPRDAEVLRDRLRAHVSQLADELVLGPVTARIDKEMNERHRAAHAELVQVWTRTATCDCSTNSMTSSRTRRSPIGPGGQLAASCLAW